MNAITFTSSYVVPAGKVLIITGYRNFGSNDHNHWWPVGSTLPAGNRIASSGYSGDDAVGCGILKNATT